MRKTITSAVAAAALSLTACSGSGSTSPLEEALASEALGEEGMVAMVFVDVAGIQDTVGRGPVELPQPEAGEWDDADRWAVGVVQEFLPPGPQGRGPVMPTSAVEWSYSGLRGTAVKAPPETIDAALEKLAEDGAEGYGRELDGLLVLQPTGVDWEPGGENSMLDSATAQALLPCLEGAHVVSMVGSDEGPGAFFEYSFATAARVDEGGQGHAWSCVHVPDGADEYADGIDGDHVAQVTVEGDVVRADLEFEATDRPVPREAEHARRAALTLDPGI